MPLHATPASAAAKGILAEYWAYRELFYFFVWRDIKVRYKQTVLGAAWAVLQPILAMLVFTALFGRVAGLPNDGIPYPIFFYAGLLPWTYFSAALTHSGNSLINSTHLITKVYFPRALVPAAAVLTPLFDLAVASVLLVGMLAYYDVGFSWRLFLLPVLILPLLGLALGLGLWLSALNVSFRDVKHTIPFLVQMGMFLSPVVYPLSMIPERWRLVAWLNPVAGIIEACRACIVGRPVAWAPVGVSVVITAGVLASGYLYFRRTERSFADVI